LGFGGFKTMFKICITMDLELLKLYNKAFKMFPNSKQQLDVRKKIQKKLLKNLDK